MKARLGLAILLPFMACAVQWLLWDVLKPYVWFLFFPTAFFSAWIGGLAGGLAATLISALLVWYVFIPPGFSFALDNPAAAFSIAVFVVMGVLFALFFARLQRAMRRTDEALEVAEAATAKVTQLYDQMRELDQLKNQFFANVSHELRTPLTLILAPLEQRLRRPASADSSPGERREDELMLRNARLLYRHVTDLLDAAKLEAGRLELTWSRLDLARLVRATASHFESLAVERRIDYVVSVPQALEAEADAEKLQRILLNLLSNAFKFTPDGGVIELRLSAGAGQVWIEVQDNGPGVPAALRTVVFERFRQGEGGVQRRRGGTGLGLAIVKDFVGLHGGTVTLDQAPGGGALVAVRLPLAAPAGTLLGAPLQLDEVIDRQTVEELEAHAPVTAAHDAPAAGVDAPLVLVVEDNPDMNGFIAAVLRPHYRVACAFDGRDGVNQALTLHPDLILADVMMPVLSGDEMVAELRRQPLLEHVPILMLTAKADDALRVRLLKEGVQQYLSKPFAVAELLARVGGLLATHRRTVDELSRSANRLRRLAEVVEKVAAARDLAALAAIVRRALRELTGADGATVVLRDGGDCHYVDEDAIGPLWKGQRFPLESCISGWTMLHAQAVAIEDIYVDPRIPYAAYRPTFVKSLAMVPIGRQAPVGALGCYWATQHLASGEELELQQALADAMSVGLANLDLYQEMATARQAAEQTAAVLQVAQRLARIGNWQWDVRSGVHVWSQEIYRIYGRDPALPPADFSEVRQYFTGESWARLAAAVDQALAAGLAYQCDAEVLRPDGSRRWITVRSESLRDADGTVVELHGTVQDITERKRAEDALHSQAAELARRVEELERFNRASTGREIEMIKLKQQVNALSRQVGQEPPYPLAFLDGPDAPAGGVAP